MNVQRLMRRSMAVMPALLVIATSGCRDEEPAPPATEPPPLTTSVELTRMAFDSAVVTLEGAGGRTVQMRVEIAERPDQRAYGLMDRDALDDDAGMIFLHGSMQSRDAGFWMYRTRIPLDIAYFDGAGRIVAIQQMMPCTSAEPSRCPGYAPGVEYFGALEANRGYFARHGIAVGDRVRLPGRVGD